MAAYELAGGVRLDPPPVPAWRLLASLLLGLLPLVCGVGLGVLESYYVSVSSISPDSGSSYSAPVPRSRLAPVLAVEGDDPDHPQRSASLLAEDGRLIGPPHSQHALIRASGGGAFSHWGDALIFSASDGTDPRANGRQYVVHLVARLPLSVAFIWVGCFALGATMAVRRGQAWARSRPPAVWAVVIAVTLLVSYAIVLVSVWHPRALFPGSIERAAWVTAVAIACLLAVNAGRLLAVSSVLSWRWPGGIRCRAAAALGAFDAAAAACAGDDVRARLARAVSVAFALAVFVAILTIRWPISTLVAAHDETLPILGWVGGPLVLCLWRRDWFGTASGLAVTFGLFALPLAARWQDVGFHGNAVGGLLPFSDASGYWLEAQRLLDGEPLNWSARRPAFAGLLATLLAATGRDLQWTLAAMTAMNAAAVYMLGRELRLLFGPVAGALTVLMLCGYYTREGGLGTTLTENLGLAVGVLGFAAMARGARELRPQGYALGLGLVTFALMARAGAFFVLPAMVGAAMWEFRRRYEWKRVAGLGVAALVVAVGLSLANGRLLSNPAGAQQAFSNFSYSLYGLVVGGKGWQQAEIDHPGAREGAEIYSLAWREFQRRPAGLLEGATKMWAVYFDRLSPYHAFAFVRDSKQQLRLHQLCFAFAGVGLLICLATLRQPLSATLLVGALAHLASIPFVPPIDAGLRVYAATMTLPVALVAVGVSVPLQWVGRLVSRLRRDVSSATAEPEPLEAWRHTAQHLGLAIVLAVLVCPQVLLRTGRVSMPADVLCDAGEVMLPMRLAPGSYLDVETGAGSTMTGATAIRPGDLRQTVDRVEIRNDAGNMTAGHVLAAAYHVGDGRPLWLLVRREAYPRRPGVYAVCASPSPDRLSLSYGLYYASPSWRASEERR